MGLSAARLSSPHFASFYAFRPAGPYVTCALTTLICFVVAMCVALAGHAESAGPFAKLSGTWRGSGKVFKTDGQSERIRCTATYSPESSGQSLSQALVCASDSYHVNVQSYIVADGQNIRGHWEESVQQAMGSLTGQIVGDRLEGRISGPGFMAMMSMVTTGSRQTIRLTLTEGSISDVQIALSK